MRFVLGLLLGVSLGISVGLIVAPQPGSETRKALRAASGQALQERMGRPAPGTDEEP